MENGQRVYFSEDDLKDRLENPKKTTLMAFFDLCKEDEFAKTLLYRQVPSYYVFANQAFRRRKQGQPVDDWGGVKKDHTLGRMYTIHPNNEECFYLRLLLNVVRGPNSFIALRTLNGVTYDTYIF